MAHVTVAGSGIAGLIASIALAREGHKVSVYEKSAHIGGRARTERHAGFHTNLGPHALYNGGRLHRALIEFGVEISGQSPAAAGVAWRGNTTHTLPTSPLGLLSTDLLTALDKLDAGRLFARLPAHLPGETAARWCQRVTRRPNVQQLLAVLIRLVCYAVRLDHISMDIVHPALVAGTSTGVIYVDGGWQSIIDGLATTARAAGVMIHTQTRLTSVDDAPGPVILAVPPQVVRRLVPEWEWTGTPVKASILDISLSRVPSPNNRFALGWDEARYFAMHSATASLAPDASGLAHVLGYMDNDEPVGRATLEALMDERQPGWRDVVHHARYLPAVTVTHDHPHARRAAHQVRDTVWVAGDWVGPTGVLADCAAQSALHSAAAVSSDLRVAA